ncbi:IclR family transcriptional regulator [Azospirillum agricola]|uniref:IclR family transcriptional regulator n=1 Tax=Azospirillum agricola TaxID=1720247 RepID=UPI000A1C7BD8|nr:IclR family transcriptional regulator [Azospirillum agricola]
MNYTAGDVETLDGDDPFPGDRQFVVALFRGLEILRCFQPWDNALGNQELAQRSGLPKATVSRLTYTLSKLGYLVYMEDSGRYRMGVPVLGLGYACLGGLKIRETAQPYLQELADHAGDGVLAALGGRDDLSMIYVSCARSAGMLSLQLNVGSRISLARSGMGRAYLAAIGDDEREALMPKLRARAGEERWPQIEAGIRRAIDEIRTRGFCMNVGDWYPQVNSVAVPFRSPQGDLPALAFNCGGPSYVLTPERLENDLGPRLVDLANKVAAFGGQYS